MNHLTVEEAARNLPTARELMGLPDPDQALDRLFDSVDDALWAGHEDQAWPHLEAWVTNIDPSDLSTVLVVGVLSILLPMRDRNQPWYTAWYARAEAVLRERRPDELTELVRGFEPTGDTDEDPPQG